MAPSAPSSNRFGFSFLRTLRLRRRSVFVSALLWVLPAALHAEGLSRCHLQHLEPLSGLREVEIARVVDGDTLKLEDGASVRLIGINTPEFDSGAAQEPLAARATAFVRGLLDGDRTLIVPGEDSRDDHGRLLAHVFDLDGNSVEAALVRRGLAWHVAIPPNLAMADCLSRLEKQARRDRLGVWRVPATPVSEVDGGGFHRLRGTVTDITFATDWWLSLENRVAARVRPRDQRHFQRGEIASLRGRTVEVRGWVYPGRGGKYEPWRVNLQTPHGLFVFPDETK